MRSCSFAVGLALACAFTASSSRAAEPRSTLALSVDDVLRRAEQSPGVILARLAVREAAARRVGAGLRFPTNPRVQADARPPVTGGTLHDMGYAFTFELPFDVGGAPSARLREADRGVDLALTDATFVGKRARTGAWATYIRAEAAGLRASETRDLVAIADRIVRASRERSAAGAAGDVDLSTSTSELALLEAQQEGALRQREEQVAELRSTLDLSPTLSLDLTTRLTEPGPPPEEASLVAQALSHRPELARLRARLAVLAATEERLVKETFPRLGLYLSVDAAPVSPIFGAVGLSVELPVAQRNQGPRAVVEEARRAEVTRLDQQLRQVVRDVTAARESYEARRREFAILQSKALPAAEKTLELVETGWLAGRFDIFRVTSAARELGRVRVARVDALEAAWLDRVALDAAVGGLP